MWKQSTIFPKTNKYRRERIQIKNLRDHLFSTNESEKTSLRESAHAAFRNTIESRAQSDQSEAFVPPRTTRTYIHDCVNRNYVLQQPQTVHVSATLAIEIASTKVRGRFRTSHYFKLIINIEFKMFYYLLHWRFYDSQMRVL